MHHFDAEAGAVPHFEKNEYLRINQSLFCMDHIPHIYFFLKSFFIQ
jgi:hypothetical protein